MKELAARNGAERAQALLQLTRRLTGLIEQETALFLDKRPHDALKLQDEKTSLANIYRHEVSLVGRDPHRLAGAAEPVKEMLRSATKAFHAALAKNGHTVNALKTLTEGVVKSVADEAARRKRQEAGYGSAGAMAPPPASLPAVAIDQRA